MGSGGEFAEDGVEGRVFEEADFETNGDDLTEVAEGGEVLAAGTEVRESEMADAGELESGGEDGGVEIDDGAELDLDAKLHGGGGESFAVEYPAATVGEGRSKGGKKTVTLFVAKTLDVERLHC